jgi:predicted DNA binding CopG/RHH family protein
MSKRGRPKSQKHGLKSVRLDLRAAEDERLAFKLAADLAGLPLSTWIRERLRKLAAKELESEGRQVPFYQHLMEPTHGTGG